MWMKRATFSSVMELNWTLPISGYGMARFSWKLKYLKGCLRDWNHQVFSNARDNVVQAEEEVTLSEARFDALGSEADLVLLNKAKASLFQRLTEEELFWKQKVTPQMA